MEAKISADELRLLVWLHENAKAFGESGAWYPQAMTKELGISAAQLAKDASYLAGHHLVGATFGDRTHLGSSSPEYWLQSLYLTSVGENYIRVLEEKPGIAQRLTIATLKKVEDVAVKIAGTVLAEIIKQQMRSGH